MNQGLTMHEWKQFDELLTKANTGQLYTIQQELTKTIGARL